MLQGGHGMQLVVVQDTVVDPLGCRPVVVDFFPLCRSLWNRRVKADVPFRLGMHGSAIFGFSPVSSVTCL